MTQVDVATLRAAKRFAKQEYDKEVMGRSGASSGGAHDDAGPPSWNRASWDSFHAQYGFYPYGMQHGAVLYPPTFAGAPPWVYELMGLRQPPVTVSP